jgi:hypothetical protein
MNNYKTFFYDIFTFIVKAIFVSFILYWIIYFFSPNIGLPSKDNEKIELILESVNELKNKQSTIDGNVTRFENEIDSLNKTILKLKLQKIIIKEIYYEEINRVAQYNDAQIDSFFTSRYGYYPSKNISDTDSKTNN